MRFSTTSIRIFVRYFVSNLQKKSLNSALKKRDLVKKALSILEEVTCARFKQNSTSKNRIRVFQGNGCFATIGMLGGLLNSQ